MKLEPGSTLADGRYRLESLRGRGGMAAVWLAADTQLERSVAIKVIAENLAAEPDFRRRFEREARAAAAVSHPHVVKLFDFGLEGDRPYLVMEWIDGPNLAELQASEPAAPLDVGRLARDLLGALAHIHGAGVVHRDIKPANLLIAPDGEVRVTDFGIARLDETTQITRAGLVVGTERYIAPEVVAGEPATPSSDLFAVGSVLHELLAQRDEVPDVRALADRLRSRDPAARPGSAAEALAMLDGPGERTAVTRVLGSDAATAVLPEGGRTTGPAEVADREPRTRKLGREDSARVVIQRGDRAVAVAPLSVVAGIAGIAALVLFALFAFRDGGDGASKQPRLPAPAAETAPLGAHMESLEEIVREISQRQQQR